MAGTLEITNTSCWMPAGWVFNNVLGAVAEKVATTNTGLANQLREATTWPLGGYVDVRDSPKLEIENLARAVREHEQETKRKGPSSFQLPEFFPGYVNQIQSLIEMLDLALSEADRSQAQEGSEHQRR